MLKIFIHSQKTLFIVFLFSLRSIGFAQDCGCTIVEVKNNAVNSCNRIIGTIDTVTTTSELKKAIINVNASGGNKTILIANGTYKIASTSWYPYITASNVVFRSLEGNRDAVIIAGTGMASVAPKTESGFYVVGNNITIADLTIKELGNHGIAVVGDSLLVHNVKIQNTFEQMIKGNSAGDGADFGKVQCSLFEYPSGVGPQFYIGGLDIHKGNNWVVNDNIFKNIASPSRSLAEHAIHFWDSSANNTIERNVIINCDRGIGFGLGSSPNLGGIIKNNMIYNDGSGLYNDVGISLESSPNTKVYNNTIYIDYPNAIEYRFAATNNVEISNNLTNKAIKARNGGQAKLITNYTNALSSWFMSLSAGDLHINVNHLEVVNKGTNLLNVMLDIDKTPRPQAKLFDIGAHELKISTGLTIEQLPTSSIMVYPNPATNSFAIKSDLNTAFTIVIYNSIYQKVASFQGERLSPSLVIDASKWQSGIYICHLSNTTHRPRLIKIAISKWK